MAKKKSRKRSNNPYQIIESWVKGALVLVATFAIIGGFLMAANLMLRH